MRARLFSVRYLFIVAFWSRISTVTTLSTSFYSTRHSNPLNFRREYRESAKPQRVTT